MKGKTPDDISGLIMWLRADDIGGSDGDAVTTWSDISGNSNNATQSTTSNKPTYKTNIINGHAVVRFDGSNDYLSVSALSLSGTNNFSIAAVFTAASGHDGVVAEHSSNYNSNNAFMLYRDSSNYSNVAHHQTSPAGYSAFTTSATLTTTPKVVIGVTDRSLASSETTAYVNGNNSGSYIVNNNTSGNFTSHALYIGARGGSSLFLNGDIAELIIYNNAISTSDRLALQDYLASRYGITI